MEIELKEKIPVTTELITELVSKSWLEIEHLQTQLNNIEEHSVLKPLLSNLLTSYYVFVGGIESLQDNDTPIATASVVNQPTLNTEIEVHKAFEEPEIADLSTFYEPEQGEVNEPFEYFVDFDEPVGAPISDEDLYGKNN